MKHDIDYMRKHVYVGQYVAVYPFNGEPYVGMVCRVRKNKYGRISYVVDGKNVMAEELFPAKDEVKLKIPRLRAAKEG